MPISVLKVVKSVTVVPLKITSSETVQFSSTTCRKRCNSEEVDITRSKMSSIDQRLVYHSQARKHLINVGR